MSNGKSRFSLSMRPGDEDNLKLINRILDPAYIRAMLLSTTARQTLDQHVLRLSMPGNRPIVPRGPIDRRPGPPPVRPGTYSDFLNAVMKVPAVEKALGSLKEAAGHKVKHEWKNLPSGAKAYVITQTVIMGAGALAGVLGSASGRKEAYELLRDKQIPVPIPGVPGLTLQFKTGRENKVMMMVDLSKLLK